jgi:hypothetical protein
MKKTFIFCFFISLALVFCFFITEPIKATTSPIKVDNGFSTYTTKYPVVYNFRCKYSYLGEKTFPLVYKGTFQWETSRAQKNTNILRINGIEKSQYRIVTSVVKNLPKEISLNLHKEYDNDFKEQYRGILQKKGDYIYTYEIFGKKKMPVYRFKSTDSVLKYYWQSFRPQYLKRWYY